MSFYTLEEQRPDILEILRRNGSELMAVVLDSPEHQDVLSNILSGDYTFFVPSDDAINYVLEVTDMNAEELINHPELPIVLNNHVYDDTIRILPQQTKAIEMLSGATYPINDSMIDIVPIRDKLVMYNGTFDLALYFIDGMLATEGQDEVLKDPQIIRRIRQDIEEAKEGKRVIIAKEKIPPNKPLTAWDFYKAEQRPILKAQYNWDDVDVYRVMQDNWRRLQEYDRIKYVNAAYTDSLRYQRELEAYLRWQ